MAWFKVDDRFASSRKLLRIPRSRRISAVGLWTLAGSWSAHDLTDGWIPGYMVEELGADEADADALVSAGLWTPDEHDGEPGYHFHKWAEYQPTRADVEAEREAARERKRRQRRNANGEFAGQDHVTPVSRRDTTVTPEMSQGCHTVPVPARPVPSRPDGSPAESRTRKRATPLPDDWTPTEAHRILATERGIDCDLEAEKMRDWAAAKGETGKDWDARFRNWLRNARPSSSARTKTSARLDGAMTLIQQLEAQEGREPWTAPRQLGS